MVTCHVAGIDSDPLAGCSTKGCVFLSQIINSLETMNCNLSGGGHRFLLGVGGSLLKDPEWVRGSRGPNALTQIP